MCFVSCCNLILHSGDLVPAVRLRSQEDVYVDAGGTAIFSGKA